MSKYDCRDTACRVPTFVYSIIFLLLFYLPLVKADSKFKIVALGDSTTAGTPNFLSPLESPPNGNGNPESQYIHAIQKRYPDWSVLNRGVNGERTDQIAARFERDVLKERPDIAIIMAGVNDLYQGRSAESVKMQLKSMYVKAGQAGIKVLACTILPYDRSTPEVKNKMKEVNQWIRDFAREQDFLFADTYHAAEDPEKPGYLAGSDDGLHPDVQTYQKIGNAVADTITRYFSD